MTVKNSLDKTEIINQVLFATSNSHVANLKSSNNSEVAKILGSYKRLYQFLLTKYPWSFATNRVELIRDNANDAQKKKYGYNYRYSLPVDLKYLWELSRSPTITKYPESNWDLQSRYSYWNFIPTTLANYFTEIAQDVFYGEKYMYSNIDTLWCLYTHDQDVPESQMNVEFVEVMINSLINNVHESKQEAVDKLAYINQKTRRDNEEAMANVSRTDGRTKEIPQSKIVKRMRSF